jgi:hypothetical protein
MFSFLLSLCYGQGGLHPTKPGKPPSTHTSPSRHAVQSPGLSATTGEIQTGSPVIRSVSQAHCGSPGQPGGHIGPAAAHTRTPRSGSSTHCPLAHWWLWLHLAPSGLGLAQAIPGMEASVPPTRAAPNSLSALPRDKVPLESPTASSSKELAPVRRLAIGYPFP